MGARLGGRAQPAIAAAEVLPRSFHVSRQGPEAARHPRGTAARNTTPVPESS